MRLLLWKRLVTLASRLELTLLEKPFAHEKMTKLYQSYQYSAQHEEKEAIVLPREKGNSIPFAPHKFVKLNYLNTLQFRSSLLFDNRRHFTNWICKQRERETEVQRTSVYIYIYMYIWVGSFGFVLQSNCAVVDCQKQIPDLCKLHLSDDQIFLIGDSAKLKQDLEQGALIYQQRNSTVQLNKRVKHISIHFNKQINCRREGNTFNQILYKQHPVLLELCSTLIL